MHRLHKYECGCSRRPATACYRALTAYCSFHQTKSSAMATPLNDMKKSTSSVKVNELGLDRQLAFDAESVSSDNAALAKLGYKQEFRRHFTPIEVFGISFSIIGIFPSIACVLVPRMSVTVTSVADAPHAGPCSCTRCPTAGPSPWSGV